MERTRYDLQQIALSYYTLARELPQRIDIHVAHKSDHNTLAVYQQTATKTPKSKRNTACIGPASDLSFINQHVVGVQ